MTPAESNTLAQFAETVRHHYGSRVENIALFGSRARGEDVPGSDADIVVVLEDGPWRVWDEKKKLVDLEYEMIVDSGIYIQPWPISASSWQNPDTHRNPAFVRAIKRDAKPLPEHA